MTGTQASRGERARSCRGVLRPTLLSPPARGTGRAKVSGRPPPRDPRCLSLGSFIAFLHSAFLKAPLCWRGCRQSDPPCRQDLGRPRFLELRTETPPGKPSEEGSSLGRGHSDGFAPRRLGCARLPSLPVDGLGCSPPHTCPSAWVIGGERPCPERHAIPLPWSARAPGKQLHPRQHHRTNLSTSPSVHIIPLPVRGGGDRAHPPLPRTGWESSAPPKANTPRLKDGGV